MAAMALLVAAKFWLKIIILLRIGLFQCFTTIFYRQVAALDTINTKETFHLRSIIILLQELV